MLTAIITAMNATIMAVVSAIAVNSFLVIDMRFHNIGAVVTDECGGAMKRWYRPR